MASESNSVICDEVFEEGCQPSNEEMLEYAVRIGICPEKEQHLLYLARDGLMQALPSDFQVCFHKTQGVYYYNLHTKTSQWEHPLDEEYKQLVVESRERLQQAAAAAADVDDTSLLDSGIRSLPTSTASTMDPLQRTTLLAPLERRVVKLQPLKSNKPATCASLFDGASVVAAGISSQQQQIDLKISSSASFSAADAIEQQPPSASSVAPALKGLQIFGTGSKFLKSNSRRTTELTNSTDDKTAMAASSGSGHWTASNVKGILRDSSLSDVNRHGEMSESQGDDRKSVRFNLVRRSGAGDQQFTSSLSSCSSQDEEDENRKDIESIESIDLNRVDEVDRHDIQEQTSVEDVLDEDKIVQDSNIDAITPQPKPNVAKLSLRSQFSLDEIRRPQPPQIQQRKLGRTFSTESASPPVAVRSSFFDRKADKNLMAPVKPLYDDTTNTTDSESAGVSLKSSGAAVKVTNNATVDRPVDRDQLRQQANDRFEAFKMQVIREQEEQEDALRQQVQRELATFKENLYTDVHGNDARAETRSQLDKELSDALQQMRSEHSDKMRSTLAVESELLEQEYQQQRHIIEQEHERRMTQLTQEFQQNTDEYQAELETRQNLEISNFEQQLKRDFDKKQVEISAEHRAAVNTLQSNHTEIFNDLERDLKSEAELLRKEHTNNLAQVRVKLEHELELEKQRMRDSGELQQFEKLRCEKRLLEDKYRCLKDKYVRLKTDVKMRLERQGQSRRSQQHPPAALLAVVGGAGSETDRSFSLNRGSDDTTDPRNTATHSSSTPSTIHTDHGKPPAAPVTPQLSSRSRSRDKSRERRSSGASPARPIPSATNSSTKHASAPGASSVAAKYLSHLHPQAAALTSVLTAAVPGAAADDTTSVSQSDTTLSNNFCKKKYLPTQPGLADNGNSDTEAFRRNQENNNHASREYARKKQFTRLKSASTSRLHAASTAIGQHKQQLQATASADDTAGARPLTPMESLRRQLQKLEDLEDQFPENTVLLDAQHPYHLRYPFKDVAEAQLHPQQHQHTQQLRPASAVTASSSELEFFKHRIHMERDAVNRAKEALRTQRTTFRLRQREIKHAAGAAAVASGSGTVAGLVSSATTGACRHTPKLELHIEQGKELTDMEVSLHRTRALLGEKVIRLRHLEQSLQRICETEKATAAAAAVAAAANPSGGATAAIGGTYKKLQQSHQLRVQQQHRIDEATVSDLSSHSSSGFSSTEYGTDTMPNKRGGDAAEMGAGGDGGGGGGNTGGVVDSMDIVQSLEHLNAEIREIWDILSKQRTTQSLPPPPTVPLNWQEQQQQQQYQAQQHPKQNVACAASAATGVAAAATAPTFFDRLETYRQFAANRGPGTGSTGGLLSTLAANTIVSQAPLHGGNGASGRYTTSLVERTQDLRNWLRQAKNEHEMLSAGPHTNL